jgi:hypothetical protein
MLRLALVQVVPALHDPSKFAANGYQDLPFLLPIADQPKSGTISRHV